MRIEIDGQGYTLDVNTLLELYRALYKQASTEGLVLQDGSRFLFNRDSLLRTGLKMIMTPFVIPFIRRLYAQHDLPLDAPIRHADLIDYSVNALIDYVKIAGENINANFTTGDGQGNNRNIETVATSWGKVETESDTAIESIPYSVTTET